MKPTARAVSEFQFYASSPLDMIGAGIGAQTRLATYGLSALECWYAKDTHGKTLPCREPDLLDKVMRSKASVNLQIKLWAEDIADGLLLRQVELLDYLHGYPEWVFRSVMEQARKLASKSIGFAPRFARLEHLFGAVWLPEMDPFDAQI